MAPERTYLPAAAHDFFPPLYDPLTKLSGAQRALLALMAQADLQPRHCVLDIGCGAGTLAILIKQRHPDVDVTGLGR